MRWLIGGGDVQLARVLGLKAALNLAEREITSSAERLEIIGSKALQQIADDATARAPTLVKDTQDIFPISPQRHPRIYFASPGVIHPNVVASGPGLHAQLVAGLS